MKKNLGMLLISVAIAFAGGEIILRQYVNPTSIYGPWFAPSQNIKGFEWQFLQSNTPDQELLKNFHPVYGWDHSATGIRNITPREIPTSSAQKILFVGDSFIYGSEVEAEMTMAAQLQNFLPNAVSTNMGVPAFGIDQSYLKLVERGFDHSPDVVIFGIHPPNYERTSIDFFHRPKPIFDMDETSSLSLTQPTNYETSEDLYQDTYNKRQYDSFLLNALINAYYTGKSKLTDADISQFFKKNDPIIQNIINAAKTKTHEMNALFLIVQIPHGNRFRSQRDFDSYQANYPLNKKLVSLYQKIGVNYIDLEVEFLRNFAMQDIFDKLYTQPGTSNSAGHLSNQGNKVTAEIIAKKLLKLQSQSHPQ